MRILPFMMLLAACLASGCATPGPVAFLFLGDTGTGDAAQAKVAGGMRAFCAEAECQFVLLLGDNVYPSGVRGVDDPQLAAKFEAPYRDLAMPFHPVLGNSDHGGDPEAQVAYTARSPSGKWIMPGRYYALSRPESQPEVDLFALDTGAFDAAQVAWLDAGLAASKARWKVVYGHHPIHSYGAHGGEPALVERLLPVLARHGVDFYLSAHDHDQQVLVAEGLVLVVSGGGGAPVRPTVRGPRSLFARAAHGFAHLEIAGGEARLRVMDAQGRPGFEKRFTK